jgi:hypothetical protein
VSRTIWIPDYGDSSSWYQPLQVPEPGEPGYMTPAERIAYAEPGDPLPAIIAREQAIEEAHGAQADLAEAEIEADWANEWDDADSNAYQARVEAGLEPEAGL